MNTEVEEFAGAPKVAPPKTLELAARLPNAEALGADVDDANPAVEPKGLGLDPKFEKADADELPNAAGAVCAVGNEEVVAANAEVEKALCGVDPLIAGGGMKSLVTGGGGFDSFSSSTSVSSSVTTEGLAT